MNDKPDSSGKSAVITLVWLVVGLAPIAIILGVLSSSRPLSISVLVICGLSNLLGGFGCLRNVRNGGARFFLGLFLSGCFFVVCLLVGVFGACVCSFSHSGGGG